MWWKTEATLASVSVDALTPSSSLNPPCESAACDGGDGQAKRGYLVTKQRITALEKRVSGDTNKDISSELQFHRSTSGCQRYLSRPLSRFVVAFSLEINGIHRQPPLGLFHL